MLRSSPCANGPPALPPPRRAHLVPPRPTGLVIVTERTGRRLDETRGTAIASVLQEVGFSTLQIGLLKRQAELTDLIEPAELRWLEIQADKWGRVHVSSNLETTSGTQKQCGPVPIYPQMPLPTGL